MVPGACHDVPVAALAGARCASTHLASDPGSPPSAPSGGLSRPPGRRGHGARRRGADV